MLIYPRLLLYRTPCPSTFCEQCRKNKNCICKCHDLDLINGKHIKIQIDEMDFKVKPVVDLNHFRD